MGNAGVVLFTCPSKRISLSWMVGLDPPNRPETRNNRKTAAEIP